MHLFIIELFLCGNDTYGNIITIPTTYLCDGDIDCPDGSDERVDQEGCNGKDLIVPLNI